MHIMGRLPFKEMWSKKMSMVYCPECDKMIDLDYTEHYVHFSDLYKEDMKGGKNDRKKN